MKLLTPIARTLPSAQEVLQRSVGVDGQLELARQRMVQDEQVDLVDAELARALVEGVQRLVVPVVGDPDLGLDEHLRAVETRAAQEATYRLTDLPLVAVRRSRVDVPIAHVQRRLDRRHGLVRRCLEDAEPQGRHVHAVVQAEEWSAHAVTLDVPCAAWEFLWGQALPVPL
jgi:hypothetical protein